MHIHIMHDTYVVCNEMKFIMHTYVCVCMLCDVCFSVCACITYVVNRLFLHNYVHVCKELHNIYSMPTTIVTIL